MSQYTQISNTLAGYLTDLDQSSKKFFSRYANGDTLSLEKFSTFVKEIYEHTLGEDCKKVEPKKLLSGKDKLTLEEFKPIFKSIIEELSKYYSMTLRMHQALAGDFKIREELLNEFLSKVGEKPPITKKNIDAIHKIVNALEVSLGQSNDGVSEENRKQLIEHLFEEYDLDCDGKLNQEELTQLFKKLMMGSYFLEDTSLSFFTK
eukprot:TRINITY_DN2294_c0_g1_i5.p1 TRINITY_DN2294_c0_g1~~TRINITY_DN2294_c0_g1_i5.p1  ORF type:complete len:205 (-),score=44.08 TRINITY_DN2294_c0_g1_i5:17-631(-)